MMHVVHLLVFVLLLGDF